MISGLFILKMVYSHISMFAEHHNHTWLIGITGMFLMWFFFKGGLFAKVTSDISVVVLHSFHKLCKPFVYLSLFAIMCDVGLYLLDSYVVGGYYDRNELFEPLGLYFSMVLLMEICLSGFCQAISSSKLYFHINNVANC